MWREQNVFMKISQHAWYENKQMKRLGYCLPVLDKVVRKCLNGLIRDKKAISLPKKQSSQTLLKKKAKKSKTKLKRNKKNGGVTAESKSPFPSIYDIDLAININLYFSNKAYRNERHPATFIKLQNIAIERVIKVRQNIKNRVILLQNGLHSVVEIEESINQIKQLLKKQHVDLELSIKESEKCKWQLEDTFEGVVSHYAKIEEEVKALYDQRICTIQHAGDQ